MNFSNKSIYWGATLCVFILILSLCINFTTKQSHHPSDPLPNQYYSESSNESIILSNPSELEGNNINSEPTDETQSEDQKRSESSYEDEIKNYKEMFTDLYVQEPTEFILEDKTVYLTFDDGPSNLTEKVLDILNKENVKATFFIIGSHISGNEHTLNRIVNEGHTIGIHTYSHNYEQIYSSVENYLEDFNKTFNLIHEVTGIYPNIFRFPGGSVNAYNKSTGAAIRDEMLRRGFMFYDWNNSSGDCDSTYSVETCIKNVLNQSSRYNRIISLMHDSSQKKFTVEALPKIIHGLKEQGFAFNKITNKIKPITF